MVRLLIYLLFFLFKILPEVAFAQIITIPKQELVRIACRIFANECFSINACLIEWNEGEEFLSLGTGHFIWYPKNERGPFEESFIKYLSFALKNGVKPPAWLGTLPACPWSSREEFLSEQKDPRLSELKEFLLATKPIQAAFLIKNLKDALPLMLRQRLSQDKRRIKRNFFLIASKPQGIYALVDYINFKGTGLSEAERYQGKGWGLFQALSLMDEKDNADSAREEFVRIAKIILNQRVANSPVQRNEQQWLAGWLRRLDTYLR